MIQEAQVVVLAGVDTNFRAYVRSLIEVNRNLFP